MNLREYCISRRKAEGPVFLKVIRALPGDRLDYRPDPKARTARDLAWTIASEEAALIDLLDRGEIRWKDAPAPATVEEIAAAYEKNAAAVDVRLARLDDARWEAKGKFVMDGMPEPWEDTIGQFLWGFLFDCIHHRGQLSTYLRPMGGKVPSIYGPSADDPGQ
jgi:uncharacterized damage-inducible protein DinB